MRKYNCLDNRCLRSYCLTHTRTFALLGYFVGTLYRTWYCPHHTRPTLQSAFDSHTATPWLTSSLSPTIASNAHLCCTLRLLHRKPYKWRPCQDITRFPSSLCVCSSSLHSIRIRRPASIVSLRIDVNACQSPPMEPYPAAFLVL